MRLKINPEPRSRILKCNECGELIDSSAPTCRGFAKAALAHIPKCGWRVDSDDEDDIAESFTIITERKFEVSQYDSIAHPLDT